MNILTDMKTPWKSDYTETFYPPLMDNLSADVCVIGGGITGVVTAYLLQQAGRRVILVEANKVGTGVTGFTSGHVTSLVDAFYHNIIKNLSKDHAEVVLEATKVARDTISQIISDNALICDFERVPAYYYATNDNQKRILAKERDALNELGEKVEKPGLDEIPVHCTDALKLEDQAAINAYAFVQGLAKSFVESGGHLYEQSRVVKMEDRGEYVRLHFDDKWMVEARHVVEATHTPVGMNNLQMQLHNHNSYVLYGESSEEVAKGLYYDLEDPYHYIRHFEENGKAMFIVGGCDTKTGDKEREQQALDKLLGYASNQLSITKTHGSWSNILFTSPDGLPMIGENPERKKCYVATGFAGDGLTYSVISAILNTALITEGSHRWEETFKPSRFSSSTIPTVLKKGVNTIKHLITEKLTAQFEDDKSFPRNSGKVLKLEGELTGLYKDANGEVKAVSGLCTHMQCVLQFNDVAKTWDCGCHGSRFNTDGRVISGPATQPLKSIEVQNPDKSN